MEFAPKEKELCSALLLGFRWQRRRYKPTIRPTFHAITKPFPIELLESHHDDESLDLSAYRRREMIISSGGVIGAIARSALTTCPTSLPGFSSQTTLVTIPGKPIEIRRENVRERITFTVSRQGVGTSTMCLSDIDTGSFHYPRHAAKQWRTVPDMCMHGQWTVVLRRICMIRRKRWYGAENVEIIRFSHRTVTPVDSVWVLSQLNVLDMLRLGI
jgi:hypothetical protein